MSSAYLEVCTRKGLKPLREVQLLLSNETSELFIGPKTQLNDSDFCPLSALLTENLSFFVELEITGQRINEIGVTYLASGLKANGHIKKLTLSRNGINSVDSITTLCFALQRNLSLESLDLSENGIEDPVAEGIKELIKSNNVIQRIILDKNLISETCFAVSLCENTNLTHFSISYNQLTFENFISLLEMLNLNRTLRHIGLKGIRYSGIAEIKENQSGVLSKDEALILKLANVLRYSNICSIAIDLNPTANLQLREIETSLLKHNSTLVNITSDNINWRNPLQGPLLGIQKAVKANGWLQRSKNDYEELPCELESIIDAKLYPGKLRKSLKNLRNSEDFELDLSNPAHFSTESPNFSSRVPTSPDFSPNSPHLSEIKGSFRENRISKQSQDRRLSIQEDFAEKVMKLFSEISMKMEGFQDEITSQVNLLQNRVHELESGMKRYMVDGVALKVAELEKKDETSQNLLMLIGRELAEVKASVAAVSKEEKKQIGIKIAALEKKVEERALEAERMQKRVEASEEKIARVRGYEGSGRMSEKERSERSEESTGSGKAVKIPGNAEELVMKAIREKNYWTVRKKLEYSREDSPAQKSLSTFFSPDSCPSKDLQNRLIQKGLNFVPRAASSHQPLYY